MINRWIVAAISVLAIQSCKQNRFDSVKPTKEIDPVPIIRFEKDLFSTAPESIESGYSELAKKYPNFSKLFTEGIIRIGKSDSTDFYRYLKMFITDTMVQKASRMVSKTFPSNASFEDEVRDAFARYATFFPQKAIPRVYTFISGYNLSLAVDDSLVAVGLDRYLGKNTTQYSLLGIPLYQQYKMQPAKIPSDIMRAWLYSVFPFHDSLNNLLSNMIYEGQIMYLTKRMLPHQQDSLIFGFTPQQYSWCLKNEKAMWIHLIENKLLFTTNTVDINKMVNDAPFTSGFPQESPGRAVVWIGYRIVERFMERNENIDLSGLMNINDYQEILNKSRYKP